ncbi:hypothetical protein NDU88_003394 [Pleurodeles waltl]|uniref:Uncharacterized protein n=1 Tax=Pleurodeles waltl TaxID=8319 RepID=A0AAV7NPK7_PLEWA|nr:hypothetical protein NDU88_003394 [Pleurodeles waltl]
MAFLLHALVAKCWRLNERLLTYEDILMEIERTMRHYLEANDNPEVGVAVFWEALKAVVRGQFIVIAARLNRSRWTKCQQLEDDIWSLEASHGRSGLLMTRRLITTLRKQLRALDCDRAEYSLLRTKQRYCTGGDRAGCLLAH